MAKKAIKKAAPAKTSAKVLGVGKKKVAVKKLVSKKLVKKAVKKVVKKVAPKPKVKAKFVAPKAAKKAVKKVAPKKGVKQTPKASKKVAKKVVTPVKAKAKVALKKDAVKPAAKKPAKLTKKELRQEATKNGLEEVFARGKQRGFVTEDEIIHIMPDVDQDIEQLEALYDKLETAGIRVVGSDEMLKIETEKIAADFEVEKKEKKVKKKEELFRLS